MSSIANHHLPIEKGNQINTCSKSGFFSTPNQIKMKIVGKKFYTTFYLNFLSHDPTWWYLVCEDIIGQVDNELIIQI
jgi:hypothetical protein